MKQQGQRTKWLVGSTVLCGAAIATIAVLVSPAAAQTAAGPSPGCSIAALQQSNGTSGPDATSAFACVADLNGDGIPDLVIGQTGIGERAPGYALFFSPNGAIKRKTCWTDVNATISLCPD